MDIDLSEELSRVRTAIVDAAVDACKSVLKDQFATGTDPEGKPWAPVKSRPNEIPLTRTGALQASFFVRKTASDTVTISSDSPYSQFHQYGTRKMVARPMLPSADDLPTRWETAISNRINQVLK